MVAPAKQKVPAIHEGLERVNAAICTINDSVGGGGRGPSITGTYAVVVFTNGMSIFIAHWTSYILSQGQTWLYFMKGTQNL